MWPHSKRHPYYKMEILNTSTHERHASSDQIVGESLGDVFGAGPFVSYLNTLHNVTAGNANALAEYQATNTFSATSTSRYLSQQVFIKG